MVDAEGAAHVSKAMPVNVEAAATAEVPAAGEICCADVGACCAVAALAPRVGAADEEAIGAGAEGPVESTAEETTWSIDELSAPHVASSSTA
jgi:hypothetical protein